MSRAFIAKIFSGDPHVENHCWLDNGLCLIERNGKGSFSVGFVWEKQVGFDVVNSVLQTNPSFVASIPSGAFWEGEAIQACEDNNVGWGGVGTLKSACSSDEPSAFTEKTTAFARRLLRQNRNVKSANYLNSLLLELSLQSGNTLKIALDDAYDLTSEHVRSSWDAYGPFNAIFKNNPNGKITADATAAADSLGVRLIDKNTATPYLHGS